MADWHILVLEQNMVGHHQEEGPSTSRAQLDVVRFSVNTMLNLYVEL